jgi:surface protein
MASMFCGCKKLDTDLSKWDVSNVMDMKLMFFNCVKFNSNISKWNVSKVKDMHRMFKYCINFNQNLNKWHVQENIKCMEMFDDCNALRKRPDWYDKYKYCNEGFNFDSIKKDSVHNNI